VLSEVTFCDFIIKKFTLTEENLMNSSQSIKLHSCSSKNTSSRSQTLVFQLLVWCFVSVPLGFSKGENLAVWSS
jgi:hypothetical protein